MATTTLTLRLDNSLLATQLASFREKVLVLPKDSRGTAMREVERRLSSGRFLKIEQLRDVSTRRAGEVIFRPRILRMGELVAAALRAGKSNGSSRHRRAPVKVKGRRKPKASTGRPVS